MQQQIQAVAEVVVAARREGRPVTIQAACMGHTDLLAAILRWDSSSPDLAAQRERAAAILGAAERGHEPCVRVLMDACPDLVHAKDDKGRTTLFFAAASGHGGCLRALLRHDPEAQVAAAISHTATAGRTALMAACAAGHEECVQLLLEMKPGMQVACVDAKGFNALMYACWHGKRACAALVLRHDPEMQIAGLTSRGFTALMYSAYVGDSKCMQLLLRHSPHLQRLNEALHQAAWRWPVALAATPLDAERAEGYRRCVELLLSKGAWLLPGAQAERWAVVRPVIQDCVARSLVPSMANEAVVGLPKAAVRKRRPRQRQLGQAERRAPCPITACRMRRPEQRAPEWVLGSTRSLASQ